MIHFHLFFTLHILHMEPTLYYQSRHSFQPQKNSCRRAQKGNSKIISSWHQQANPIKKFQLPHFSEPSYLPSVTSVSILKFWALSTLLFSLRLVTTLFASGSLLQVALKNYFESSESTIQEQLLMKTI